MNHEARSVAPESYELCFAISDSETSAQIYFDMEVDMLSLGAGNFSPSGDDPAASFIRQLHPRDLERVNILPLME